MLGGTEAAAGAAAGPLGWQAGSSPAEGGPARSPSAPGAAGRTCTGEEGAQPPGRGSMSSTGKAPFPGNSQGCRCHSKACFKLQHFLQRDSFKGLLGVVPARWKSENEDSTAPKAPASPCSPAPGPQSPRGEADPARHAPRMRQRAQSRCSAVPELTAGCGCSDARWGGGMVGPSVRTWGAAPRLMPPAGGP